MDGDAGGNGDDGEDDDETEPGHRRRTEPAA
jgi:hypothetical protein